MSKNGLLAVIILIFTVCFTILCVTAHNMGDPRIVWGMLPLSFLFGVLFLTVVEKVSDNSR